MRWTGFRLDSGSWKIIAIAPPRSRRSSGSSCRNRSRPFSQADPLVTRAAEGNRPSTASPVSDLPEPLSPTIANVSPAATDSDTPRTGWMVPDGVSIAMVRACTSSSAPVAGGRPGNRTRPTPARFGPGWPCGSIASRNASHSAFIARMVSASAAQGHNNSNGAWFIVPRAAPIIRPQDGAGGTTPSPRKDRPDSSTTAEAAARLNCTATGPATFGRIVRSMMRSGPAPSARIASTYSCERTDSTPA